MRIQNVTPFGIDLTDVKYITEDVHAGLLERSQLAVDDVLMTITGRIGTCSVVTSDVLPANINQHIVRMRINSRLSPRFLAAYLNSDLGQTLSNRGVTGTTRLALDYDSIRAIPVPEVSSDIQAQLVTGIEAANQRRAAAFREADTLLAGMDEVVRNALNLPTPTITRKSVFTVNAKAAFSSRFDPEYHNPFYTQRVDALRKLPHDTLENIVEFSSETWDGKVFFEDTFPYIEISGVSLKTGEYETTETPTDEAPSRAKMVVRAGDIIISTTRPHRGAIATIRDLAIASTGFCVLRKILRNDVSREYLQWVMMNDYVLYQFMQRSSGGNYPAITADELKKVLIPLPSEAVQKAIVGEVRSRQGQAAQLKREAEMEWAAKARFEIELLKSEVSDNG
ncbi:hypothetical protein FACS1894167_02920 [Synergistales bacterium]|nr:hypothetical protein FACS1894167_02920 [Synergistales bacterium]